MTDLRRIDALVAEHVMGLDLSPVSDFVYRTTQGPRKSWDGEPDLTKEGWEEHDSWERFDFHEERYWRKPLIRAPSIRPYSSDIAATWEVVEKFRDKGLGITIDSSVKTPNGLVYRAVAGTGNGLVEALAGTASLAICLVALKAKGVEIPE